MTADRDGSGEHRGPSSESRHGTNPREMVRGGCRALGYGDLSDEEGACDGS